MTRQDPPSSSTPDPRKAARITIRETADGLGIHNPARRNLWLLAFMMVWLTGWAAGEYFAVSQILRGRLAGPDGFLVVWLVFWSLAGAGALAVVGWQARGVERLFFTGGHLVTETGFAGLSRRRVYPAAEVVDLRAEPSGHHEIGAPWTKGSVRFAVGGRERSFGIQLDDAEAAAVLAALARHLPRPDEADET